MSCFRPLNGWLAKERNVETGKRSVVFDLKEGLVDRPVTIPCGCCVGCRLQRSREWAVRCLFESQLYDRNCFLTLTFDDDHLPDDGSIDVRYLQLFMKKLRKKYISTRVRSVRKYPHGHKIRYFACGEYGELCDVSGLAMTTCKLAVLRGEIKPHGHIGVIGRPHYHLCVFNHDFDDKELYSVRNGCNLYTSEELKSLWSYGYSTVGDVTFDSAAYIARYCLKKQKQKLFGEEKDDYYKGKVPEFVVMSRRPGIASDWIAKYSSDVYPHDFVVANGGHKLKPPRFFDDYYELNFPDEFLKIKALRKHENSDNPDNYPHRLDARENCAIARTKRKVRNYENEGV